MANLLAEGNPILDIGLGLLAASGPQPFPVSTGQALARGVQFAGNRNTQRIENELQRERIRRSALLSKLNQAELDQFNQQNLAREQLFTAGPDFGEAGFGVLQNAGQPAPIESLLSGQPTPEALGLLADASPDQFASSFTQSLFQTERAEPSEVRIARVLADPNEPESVKQELRNQIREDTNEQLLQTLEAQSKFIEIQSKTNDLQQQKLSIRQKKQAVADEFTNTVNRAEKLLEANNTLEGTFLETGKVAPDQRRTVASLIDEAKSLFGKEDPRTEKLISAQDTFKKNASGFAIDLIANLENATDRKFQALRDSIANLGISPETNRQIIADVIERALQEAVRFDAPIPETTLKKAEQVLQKIRGNNTGNSGGGTVDVGGGATLEITDG